MSFNTNTDIWLAGALAAFSVDLLVYPLDTLKTRIQSPNYNTLYKRVPSSSPTQSAPPRTSRPTPFNIPTLLSRHTSFNPSLFRGLYQGLTAVIFVTIPSSGAFFSTYEALKYTLSDASPPNSTLYLPQPVIHAISSGGAELVSCAILTPAEVVKQNAQVFNQQPPPSSSTSSSSAPKVHPGRRTNPTIEVLRHFRSHPTKLFRGYTALAARNLPFTGLQFPLFEHLKSYFLDRRKRKRLQRGKQGRVDGIFERAQVTALSAALAGTGAAWITTPIDVVKTRIMLEAGEEVKNPHSLKDGGSNGGWRSNGQGQGATDVVRQIMRTEGIRGMFRGAMLRSVWTAFGSGLYLGCYEAGRHYLEERRRSSDDDGDGDGDEVRGRRDQVVKDWKNVKVGIGESRSQGQNVRKSAWQE